MYTTWTMRDGSKVEVKTMTTLHIKNTVAMLQRRAVFLETNKSLLSEMSQIMSVFEKVSKTKERSDAFEKADTNIMEADVAVDQAIERNNQWIQTFQNELYLRETN